jgi:hypothetical protein
VGQVGKGYSSGIQLTQCVQMLYSDATTCLVKVTKHRLYGLISVFTELGADASSIVDAMRMSVIQGDDLALSLLLGGLARVYPHIQMEVRKSIDELVTLAEQSHSTQLASRLRSVLVKRDANTPQLAVRNDYMPYGRQTAGRECEAQHPNYGGYYPAAMRPAVASVDTVQNSPAPVCAVDRVTIADITVEQFRREYVLRNRPVILTAGDNFEQTASDAWGLDALLQEHGDIREVSSAIPYATLFGHTEVRSLQYSPLRLSTLHSSSTVLMTGGGFFERLCSPPRDRNARLLGEAGKSFPEQLSGGERRRSGTCERGARSAAVHFQRHAAGMLRLWTRCLYVS